MPLGGRPRALLLALTLLFSPLHALADEAPDATTGPTSVEPPSADSDSTARSDDPFADYLRDWDRRVKAAQASQPHWITPLATVTPRLEQEFRYDQAWQTTGAGAEVRNFDGGKGLELIPTSTNEIILNLPPYIERSGRKPAQGAGDWPFLVIKQRLASANEAHGNYIVSAFLGVQAPIGAAAFTNHAWVITPTLAAGKGWGRFDIQGTIGAPIPLEHEREIGVQVVTNLALQYHLGKLFWPEVEANVTYWADGPRGGKTQVFITPGLILGRIPLGSGVKGIIGAGYQVAVSPHLTTSPALTPVYDHAVILSARAAF